MNARRMRMIVTVLCIAAALLLPACQPTPTQPVIANKDNNKLVDKILDSNTTPPAQSAPFSAAQATPAAAVADVPAHVKESFDGVDGKLIINVDADVFLPDAAAVPVVKVKPGSFTQDQVNKMVAEFMQGKPMYLNIKQSTKKQIQEAIIRAKAELLSEKDKENKKELQDTIDRMEEDLKTAPDTVQGTVPSTGKLEKNTKGKGIYEMMQAVADLGKSRPASIYVKNSEDGRQTQATFKNMEGNTSLEWQLEGQPRGVSMALEYARALAEKTVGNLDSDLRLAQTGVVLVDNGTKNEDDDSNPDLDAMSNAFLFYFTRTVGGVPTTYTENDCSSLTSMEDNYTKPWSYEKIRVVVDDTGIVDFQWISPMQLLDTMSENVPLLAWKDIYGIFKKMIVTSNAWATGKDTGNEKSTYMITRIVLGLSRISAKDKPDEYMLVPVWDFFGYHTTEGAFGKARDVKNAAKTLAMSELTINAIDGTVIDRGLGY